MKEQTPLERLISEIDKLLLSKFDDSDEPKILELVKSKAESLLPEERKMVEEAYSSAQLEMVSVILSELKSINIDLSSIPVNYMGNANFIDKEDATEYFTTKFKQ